MKRFEGRCAVVTGGASGIGAAIVQRFAEEGAETLILDCQAGPAEEVASRLNAAGAAVRVAAADVADLASVRAVLDGLPRIDVLVNCAGIAHIGNVVATAPADLDRLYAVNVKGVYHTLHVAVPRMLAQGGGAILNIASVAARLGISDRFAYSMTKGAVLAMTLSVARDFVRQGVRCNCLCPARVHTPFVDGYLERHYPDRRDEMFRQLSDYQPLGRMGRPEEIAALAAFLCSEDAGFITGAAYDIDGGVMGLR